MYNVLNVISSGIEILDAYTTLNTKSYNNKLVLKETLFNGLLMFVQQIEIWVGFISFLDLFPL